MTERLSKTTACSRCAYLRCVCNPLEAVIIDKAALGDWIVIFNTCIAGRAYSQLNVMHIRIILLLI